MHPKFNFVTSLIEELVQKSDSERDGGKQRIQDKRVREKITLEGMPLLPDFHH